MNRKLLVLFFAMFLLEGVFGLVGAINYTASSSSEVYTGFSWDNYKNYSISWNEYLGNLFYTSGYVGIGTTTPQQKLDVVGNINSTGFINATTDVCIQGGACLSTVSASAGGWTKTGTQVALTTATDNVSIGSTDFFVDNSKGYVGIGTTAPKKELDIVGNIKVSGYVYSNGCPNDMAYVSSAGGFCIDKWEASRPDATDSSMGSDTSMAISQAGVIPWVSISQIDSRTACNNAGKRLCSDEEWLAAANIQGQVYYLPTNLAVSPYYCVTDSSTYCLGHSYSAGDACNTGNKTGCVSK